MVAEPLAMEFTVATKITTRLLFAGVMLGVAKVVVVVFELRVPEVRAVIVGGFVHAVPAAAGDESESMMTGADHAAAPATAAALIIVRLSSPVRRSGPG